MAESFGGLVQLVRSFNDRLSPSRGQQRQDGGPRGRFHLMRLSEQGEASHARAPPDQVRDIHRRLAPCRVSQRGQNATDGKRGERVVVRDRETSPVTPSGSARAATTPGPPVNSALNPRRLPAAATKDYHAD